MSEADIVSSMVVEVEPSQLRTQIYVCVCVRERVYFMCYK